MDVDGELTKQHSRRGNDAGSRASIALGLAVLSVLLAVAGFLVSGFLTLLGVLAGIGSVTVALRVLRRQSGGATKVLALVAVLLATFVVLAVVWLIVAFTVNPPD
jgi:hypothetical protein